MPIQNESAMTIESQKQCGKIWVRGSDRGSRKAFQGLVSLKILRLRIFRVRIYESKGRGFESRRAHQTRSPPFTGGDFVCMNRADSKPRPVREWGKGLTTAGGGNIISPFLSRNKRAPLWGVAQIEAAFRIPPGSPNESHPLRVVFHLVQDPRGFEATACKGVGKGEIICAFLNPEGIEAFAGASPCRR